MPKNKQITTDSFASAATELNAMHKDLMAIAEDVVSRAIAIGEKLDTIKKGLGHGGWEAWVKDHLIFSSRTARRYMEAYRYRNDSKLKADPVQFMLRLYGRILPRIPVTEQAVPVIVTGALTRIGPTRPQDIRKITFGGALAPNFDSPSSKDNDRQPEVVRDAVIESNRTPASEMLLESDTQSAPIGPLPKHLSREIRPEVAAILNLPTSPTPLPEETVDAQEANKAADIASQWLAAISTAQEAIRELERLQVTYQVHLQHVIDFGPVKKILAEAEHLPVPDKTQL
jgi:hypothetical protein